MEKLFEESDTAVERRILDSELRQDARLSIIEQAASEGVVDDLCLRIGKLDKYWNRSVIEATVEPALILEPPIKSEQHVAPPPAGYMAARPNGHRVDNHHPKNEQGLSPPSLIPWSWVWPIPLQILLSYMCSRMQFTGPAKRWIQSATPKLQTMQWSEFRSALHTRFDRDQHEFLLRQLYRIRQTSSVQDYVDRFSQLTAYDPTTNSLHYITRFTDGLHRDIRAIILVQHPSSLDWKKQAILQRSVTGGVLMLHWCHNELRRAPTLCLLHQELISHKQLPLISRVRAPNLWIVVLPTSRHIVVLTGCAITAERSGVGTTSVRPSRSPCARRTLCSFLD
ncbi:unnamed protein product [Miscanthus lutarioriparius]|uniref:Retrotransposon gag domain-containing protein n=1 Tax=Miscanthus lutarioriparius TaxID=422564 RepID=A0A811NIA0_9POAL|nr:unnamed protein product [Miscanthus lutarioriparius]